MAHRVRIGSVGMLAMLSSLALAQAGTEAVTPAEALAALEKEREASTLGHVEKAQAFVPRYEAFARDHPGTEEALTAWLYLLQQTWWERKAGTMEESAGKVLDRILEAYPDSPQLVKVGEYYYVLSAEQRRRTYRRLLEQSPHGAVKAAALLQLARQDRREGQEEEARQRFRRLGKEFGELPHRYTTYAALADAYLNRIDPEDLKVGCQAPEIVGVDHLGRALKLSDHRGKVVVLDFWGDW